jgi:hypothetical protein
LTVDPFKLRVGIGKMKPYVAEAGSTQEGIANGMDEYIGIGMAGSSFFMFDTDTPEPELTSWFKPMRVESKTDSHLLFFGI